MTRGATRISRAQTLNAQRCNFQWRCKKDETKFYTTMRRECHQYGENRVSRRRLSVIEPPSPTHVAVSSTHGKIQYLIPSLCIHLIHLANSPSHSLCSMHHAADRHAKETDEQPTPLPVPPRVLSARDPVLVVFSDLLVMDRR